MYKRVRLLILLALVALSKSAEFMNTVASVCSVDAGVTASNQLGEGEKFIHHNIAILHDNIDS